MTFDRARWARLRAATPLTLGEEDLAALQGINEALSLDEVVEVYLPLARLLHLYVAASQGLYRVTDTFLGNPAPKVPYVIGLGGSVAVGKSTTARVIQALLAHGDGHPRVALVPTDGFLHPNRVLAERGLMERKGFPESYDVRQLVAFLADLKSGRPRVTAPVYSHTAYDIVPGEQVVERPDIVLVEGLNVLQTSYGTQAVFVSDFFDFSVYVDAEVSDIERWYIARFLTLRSTVFRDPASYFRRYADLSEAEAIEVARGIWRDVNAVNLEQNIRPTRERAALVLEKGPDHRVRQVRLRKL